EVDGLDQTVGMLVIDRRQAETDILVAVVGFARAFPGERGAFARGAKHFVWIIDPPVLAVFAAQDLIALYRAVVVVENNAKGRVAPGGFEKDAMQDIERLELLLARNVGDHLRKILPAVGIALSPENRRALNLQGHTRELLLPGRCD